MIYDLSGKHDLNLSTWGPYTKRYIGISHIPDIAAGLRFDLSVFPGLYRRRAAVPSVMWENTYHPWAASADLSYYCYRHELLWKDQLYCDTAYLRLDEQAVLISCECVNNTGASQNLVLHHVASMNFPPIWPYSLEPIRLGEVELPPGGVWIDALDYARHAHAVTRPQDNLMPDGTFRGEVRAHGFVNGRGLGRDFGRDAGDTVTYRITLPQRIDDAMLLVRYRGKGEVAFDLAGCATGLLTLAPSEALVLAAAKLGRVEGQIELTLTSRGGAGVEIDGLAVVPVAAADQVRFGEVEWQPAPRIEPLPNRRSVLLKYENVDAWYGMAWGFSPSMVRQFYCDDLAATMQRTMHDHVSTVQRFGGDNHYTDAYMRPIVLEAGQRRTIFGLVCTGERAQVEQRLAKFDPDDAQLPGVLARARATAVFENEAAAPADPYAFSQRLMATTMLTNVVYPVVTKGTYIRHHTPGRIWDCLYTWDSGFIGLGLLELDTQRAVDCLNAYVTEPGDTHAAFIHHGSPVPVQMYVFLELWNRTQDRRLLEYFYPRLRQYHAFLAGRLGSSTTRNLASGLLRTWDYFYNSGGWDDYPPQKHVHAAKLEASVTPAINTSHAIRTAKILRMAALALGATDDVAEFDRDIAEFTAALQTHSYDAESGYFSYVCHDDAGRPSGILRHDSGVNFNMGMDGAYPLVAGVCTPAQRDELVARLADPHRMMTPAGLTTVDQSAPYFAIDGYWNGTVWMPHQWFFWKTLLGLGRGDLAHRVARIALDMWRDEVGESYNCFEHFLIATRRGAGWHQFGALSAPVLCWYAAYHRPGNLTAGFDVWTESLQFSANFARLDATLSLHGDADSPTCLVATMQPGRSYAATWNDQPAPHRAIGDGVIEITLPTSLGRGRLAVYAKGSLQQ